MALDTSALMGDLVLAFGGAVGGALIVALIATVTGRNAGLLPIVLGVLIGGAGLPLGWRLAAHPPSFALAAPNQGQSQDAAALGDNPIIGALKRYYPEEFGKLATLEKDSRWNPLAQVQALQKAQAIAADLVRRKAPLADDENIMAFVRMARDVTADTRERSPKACGQAMSGSVGPMTGLMTGPRKAESEAILARFLEQTATRPAASHASVDIRPAVLRMAEGALRRLPSGERGLFSGAHSPGTTFNSSDPKMQAAYCDFAIAAFDELLSRSPHESAGVMRTLMLKQGF